MSDANADRAHAQKLAAVESLIHNFVTASRTAGLYKPGHPAILQLSSRSVDLLVKTLGSEENLTLNIKGKTVVVDECELPGKPETTDFASGLHTLGIGQLLLTNRMLPEGMHEFFKILTTKADDKTNLTELQRAVQSTRIDGLQMAFVLSFVVTGEAEVKEQVPGQLGPGLIEAYLKAATLPDLLTLLFKQNEPLIGKQAEAVTDILDKVLNRIITLEEFASGMPWRLYDPRLKARFDEFSAAIQRPARWDKGASARAARPRWKKEDLISWAAALKKEDLLELSDHHSHEKAEAITWALLKLHDLLDDHANPKLHKYALMAYLRLLADMAKDGMLEGLFKEFPRWQTLEQPEAWRKELRERLIRPPLAANLVAHVGTLAADSPEFARLAAFLDFLGKEIVPLLLGELPGVSDKAHRGKFCALLALCARKVGLNPFLGALGQDDWFLVANVAAILGEAADPAAVSAIIPLLTHNHVKVREAASKALIQLSGEEAEAALAEFIARADPAETAKSVIAVSLLSHPGVDSKLIAACRATPHYATQVSVITALGRIATKESMVFLKQMARRTWFEILTGRNKELRLAARRSLETLRKEGVV